MTKEIPDGISGLSAAEVSQRILSGHVNRQFNRNTKSVRQILRGNLLTFFNILNLVFALLIIFTGTFANLAFMIVVVFNLVIGLVQEFSAKRTLDRLSLLVVSHAVCLRDGKISEIQVSDVVQDDVLMFVPGDQICADCSVLAGSGEFNESLITGESDNISKGQGDTIYSGSYLVSGKVWARAEKIGEYSFSGGLSRDAKRDRPLDSGLMRSINAILKTVSVIIIPLGLFIFLKQDFITGLPLNENTVSTVAAMISMIPEGLVLLTSMALASSAVILAWKKSLVQNLYAAENLARADTVCFDKTGTLTSGKLRIKKVAAVCDFSEAIGNYIRACEDCNPTFAAVKEYFQPSDTMKAVYRCGFSSERKYSCVSFESYGSLYIGAYDILFAGKTGKYDISEFESDRFVVFARSESVAGEGIPSDIEALAFFVFEDELNSDAEKTLEYLFSQGIDVKILTGDSAGSVRTVAGKIGFEAKICDMSCMGEDADFGDAVSKYNVFCRVLPMQKKQIVSALKAAGHTVAMVGDGVNDVPALREADCSIAMAAGSDVSRNISDIVQMNSDFSSLPDIFGEGRRVINNIQRVASLFTTKTMYSIMISLLILIMPSCIYPFSPLQLTVISFITIGFPAFFLSFEPNTAKVTGGFLSNVLKRSVPGALCIFAEVLIINIVNAFFPSEYALVSALTFVVISVTGLFIVAKLSWPFTRIRLFVLLASIGVFAVFVFVYPISLLSGMVEMPPEMWVLFAALCTAAAFLFMLFEKVFSGIVDALSEKTRNMRKKRAGLRTQTQ